MLVLETIAKIRLAHFQHGKSIKRICRELKVSRYVVRKVVCSGETEFRWECAVQREMSNLSRRSARFARSWIDF